MDKDQWTRKNFPGSQAMSAGPREDKKSTARTSNTKANTKKTTSTSTSMVAVTDDVTKLREQIASSSCVNNGRKKIYSETKKKRAGSKLARLLHVVQPPCLMS